MNITKVTTERIPPGAHGLVAAAHIEGEGLVVRAIPLAVKFGNVSAERIVPMITAQGVRAVFRQMPPAGARLSIGYIDEPLVETAFEWAVPPPEPMV